MSSTNPSKHRHHSVELLKERAAELKTINKQLRTDITERKRAEEALRESEQKYRSLFENMLNGFAYCRILLDENDRPVDFVYLEVNDAFERLTGLKRENVVGKMVTEAIPGIKEAHPELFDIYGKVALTGEEEKFDINFEPLDIWLSISVYSPRKGYFVAVFENITDRKRAEEALLTSEEKMRLMFESVTDGIVLTDLNGVVTDANERALRIGGFGSKSDIVGRSAFETMAGYERVRALADMQRLLEQGAVGSEEYELKKADGSVYLAEISSGVLRDNGGNPTGFVNVIRDITERKRAEEEIKASLKEKEVLLKEIHHRVKNNLQVVSSLLYLQSEHIKDEQSLATIKESQNRVKSMALVHEQLYQSKGLARVDFIEYIRNLATYLFRSYGVDPDAITLKINADDVSLGIDTAIPCGLIINELVSNSLEYAFPAGKARGERESEIRINLHAYDNKLTLTVSDNGVGLPGDLDFRNTESFGLHLVNTLTRQLEGSIELDRSGGTAFEITFAEPQRY